MVDSAPNCVSCGGKCHQSRDGREQKCYWCRCVLTRRPETSRHCGRKVTTWEVRPMDGANTKAPLIVLEMA